MKKLILFFVALLAFPVPAMSAAVKEYTVVCYSPQHRLQEFLAHKGKSDVNEMHMEDFEEMLRMTPNILDRFSTLMNDAVQKGWRPQGGIGVHNYVNRSLIEVEYCQALVR